MLYIFYRLGFFLGIFNLEKKESYLDLDAKYINPLKTRFLDLYDEDRMGVNDNISDIFYDKEEYAKSMQEEQNSLEKIWRTRILFENTPRGNIIMFYDPYKMGFSFYCDQKVISYDILNAAAMKYVRFYRCRDFFLDESITPVRSPLIELYFTEDKKPIKKEDKTAYIRPTKHIKEKNEKVEMNKPKEPEKMKNKFMYLGKIGNFNMLKSMPKKHKVLAKFTSPLLDSIKLDSGINREKLTYKDFKKAQEAISKPESS